MQTRVDPSHVTQAQPNAEQRNLEDNISARHCRVRLVLLETFGFWAQPTALKGPDSILQLL